MTLKESIIKAYGDNKITVAEYFRMKDIWNDAINECDKIALTEPLKVDKVNTLCSCGKAIAEKIRNLKA